MIDPHTIQEADEFSFTRGYHRLYRYPVDAKYRVRSVRASENPARVNDIAAINLKDPMPKDGIPTQIHCFSAAGLADRNSDEIVWHILGGKEVTEQPMPIEVEAEIKEFVASTDAALEFIPAGEAIPYDAGSNGLYFGDDDEAEAVITEFQEAA